MPLSLIGLSASLLLVAGSPGMAAKPPAPAKPSLPEAPPEERGAELKAHLVLPLLDARFGDVVVATAGEEAVTLDDLALAIAGAHGERTVGAAPVKKDFMPLLERLVEARLVVSEARAMGIEDLPEVKASLESFDETTLLDLLQKFVTRDVRPDAVEVEQLYREATREWRLRSVLFGRDEHAKAFHKAVVAGGDFDALAKKALADGNARGEATDAWARRDAMLPLVAQAVVGVEPGKLAAPVALTDGWAVVRVEEIRYGEDPKARAEAGKRSVARQSAAVLKAYYADMAKRYTRTDRKVLASVDYRVKKEAWEPLKKDKRVLVYIKGAPNVTVADLTAAQLEQFFHGVDQKKGVKVNLMKEPTLDGLVSRRIVPLEARRVGIVDGKEYQRRRRDHLDGLLFSLFVQRAVLPDVKVTDADVQAYYDGHKAEFQYPIFYRLESIPFGTVKDAQAAADKLRAGTDPKWLKQNAPGQLSEDAGNIRFEGGVVASTGIPADLQDQFRGVKPGDVRVLAFEGQFFAVQVTDVTPEKPMPFDEVSGGIRSRLFGEAIGKGIQDYAAKIRKVRPVTVYLTRIGA